MNKKIKIVLEIAVSCIIMLIVSSCGLSTSVPDSMEYLPGTDMQYFQVTETNKTSLIQETDSGCYLYHDRFIYYLDREAETITPLCTKANCLHDRENDTEKRALCIFIKSFGSEQRGKSAFFVKTTALESTFGLGQKLEPDKSIRFFTS